MTFRLTQGAAEAAPLALVTELPAEQRQEQPENLSLYCASEVRVLILDDDQPICRVIQAALAPSDYKVDAVSEPTQMEAALKSGPTMSSFSTM